MFKEKEKCNLIWKNTGRQCLGNHKKPHPSLKGKTLYEKLLELKHLIPTQPEVSAKYREKEVQLITRILNGIIIN